MQAFLGGSKFASMFTPKHRQTRLKRKYALKTAYLLHFGKIAAIPRPRPETETVDPLRRGTETGDG